MAELPYMKWFNNGLIIAREVDEIMASIGADPQLDDRPGMAKALREYGELHDLTRFLVVSRHAGVWHVNDPNGPDPDLVYTFHPIRAAAH